MKKKPFIVVLLEPLGSLIAKIAIVTTILVICAAGIEKIFDVPIYSDMMYLKDCYVHKVPYIITNLSDPDEITLYDYIDKDLADAFYADATVKVVNGSEFKDVLEKWYGNSDLKSAVGLCVHPEKTIYLRDKGSAYNYSLTLVHEYAHYIVRNCGYAAETEFDESMQEEMHQFKKAAPSIGDSIEEYKAETFAYYILLPEMLEKLAPSTYQYHNNEYQRLLDES